MKTVNRVAFLVTFIVLLSTSHFVLGGGFEIQGGKNNSTTNLINATKNPLLVTLTFVKTDYNGFNISCNGLSDGGIDLTPTDGVAPYNFIWSTGDVTEDLSNLPAGTYTVTVTDDVGDIQTGSVTLTEPAVISIPSSVTDVACFGTATGAIDITPSGGAGTYSYSWNNGAVTEDVSGLIVGTYKITVTDLNSCTSQVSINVNQPTALGINGTVTDVGCNGGSTGGIDITVSGGTIGYNYLWSNAEVTEDLTGLTAGTYTVTVTDANSCTISQSFVVNEPLAIVIAPNITNILCNGLSTGAIDITVTNGVGALTYLWSNAAITEDLTGLVANDYTVTVTDANTCTAVQTFSVTQPTAINLSAVVTNVSCNGAATGSIDLTASGGTGTLTFLWSNAAVTEDLSGLVANDYTVTVTDANSCTAVQTFSVTQPTAINLSAVVTNVSCNGAATGAVDLTASGGTGTLSFLWSNAAVTEDLSGLVANDYTVTVTDANACTAVQTFSVTQPSAINLSAVVTNVSCNGAATGVVDLTASGGTGTLTFLWSNAAVTEDLSGLVANDYTVTVTDANACTAVQTFSVTQPVALTAPVSFTQATCGLNNGTATVAPAGGTGAYSYLWSNGGVTSTINGLAAGTFTVTVTDANLCTATNTVTVTTANAPVISNAVVNNVTCFGASNGVIDITVTGGTGAISYIWSNSAVTQDLIGITANTYTVTVSDINSCTASQSYVVTQPSGITVPGVISNVSCNAGTNGAINITASGGTGAFTYLWSNASVIEDQSGLIAGTYTVTVTDANSCTGVNSFTVTQPSVINLSGVVTNILCNGDATGAINITATGGTGSLSYLWSNGSIVEDQTGLVAGTYTVTVTDLNLCTATQSFTVTEPSAISISANVTNLLCTGISLGGIDLTVSGGTGAISYQWSNGSILQDLLLLLAGNYTVTVTDANGCSVVQAFTVGQPAAINISGVVSNVLCNGQSNGAINITTTGGTGAFTYLWSNSSVIEDQSGLIASTYTVTATDANSCTGTNTFTVTQPAAISLSGIVTNVLCNGAATGAINITASGGTGTLTYLWSNGSVIEDQSGLIAGTYTVTVTDANACTATQSFTITQPTALAVPVSSTQATCGNNNGTASVNPSGGTGVYSYLWSNGGITATITNLNIGTYTVTVTDANLCTATNSVNVTAVNSPSITSSSVTNVLCNGQTNGAISITASGGTGSLTYLWSNSSVIEDQTGLIAGPYTVTVTDANSCTATQSFTVTQPAAINISGSITNVLCNGASTGAINITASGGTGTLTYLWSNASVVEDQSGLIAGTYTVTVTDANACSATNSFTITQPTAIGISGAVTNVACNGGTTGAINITATGGTGTLTYLWSNASVVEDQTGLSANTYTVTVTDANACSATNSFVVTQPTAIGISGVVTNISCNGGSTGAIDITATGGAGTFTYLWSNASVVEDQTGLSANTYTVTVTDANACSATNSFTITQAVAIGISGVVTNVSCNGGTTGTIDITATGGTGTLTYLWSNTSVIEDQTGLSANNYTVTVTDANACSATNAFTVTQPAAIGISGIVTNVLCNGGSTGAINITATGGTGTLTYLWSNASVIEDQSGLIANTYTVTVTDANACSATQSFIVTEPVLLTVSVSSTQAACLTNNGTATATPAGGTGANSYLWSNGDITASISGLAVGTYTVTVTDANLCTATNTVNVTSVNSPVISASSVTNVSCNGGSDGTISITATGGTGTLTYLWSNTSVIEDQTGLTANNYTVTVTDVNSCTATQSFSVTQPTVIAITSINTNVLCNGAATGAIDITASGGTGTLTYLWNDAVITQDRTALLAGTYTVTVTDANLCTSVQSFTITQPTVISIAGTVTNVNCFGTATGSIDITATGGAGTYVYLWSNSSVAEDQISLIANTYTVTVTDVNLCTASNNFSVSQPATIGITAVITDVLCNGASTGALDITATGGTGAYTYLWNDASIAEDRTGLAAGSYTVTVTDANSCSATQTFTITQPALITISSVVTNVSCNGGSTGAIDITVSGGTGAYSYLWNDAVVTQDRTALSAGTYTVTVTDANLCTASQSFTITQSTSITISPAVTNVLCNGGNTGAINITVSGGTGTLTYLWSNSSVLEDQSALTANTYTVTVTDANLCTATLAIPVTQPTALGITSVNTDVLCNAAATGAIDITATGGTGAYTYLWNNSSVVEDRTNISAGTYTVTVTDANSCSSTQTFTLTQPAAISISPASTNVNCNGAANGAIDITVSGGIGTYSYLWSNTAVSEDLSGISAGTYSVTVTDANSCTRNQSFSITQPALITGTFTQSTASCGLPNGSLTVTAGGGVPNYSYLWSTGDLTNSITNIPAGTYTVTITDSQLCSRSFTRTITSTNIPVITTNAVQNVRCNSGSSGSIDIAVSGAPNPYTYVWSNGVLVQDLTNIPAGNYTVTVTAFNGCTQTSTYTITQPALLTATGVTTSSTCGQANGSATVTVGGGTPPYNYLWNSGSVNDTITNLTAGTYTVTVTDFNGCTRKRNIPVTLSNGPVITLVTQIDVSCFGGSNGSIDISVSGGTPPYDYLWTTSDTTEDISNLLAGVYTVFVTDSTGCADSLTFDILEPAELKDSLVVISPAYCNSPSGSINLIMAGGTGSYTYVWSNSAVTALNPNLIPGNYTVTVTDSLGCDTVLTYSVPGQPGVSLVQDSIVNPVCFGVAGGSVYITASGGLPPYQFAWNDGNANEDRSGLLAGNYSVIVTDSAGCKDTVFVTLTSPPAIAIQFTMTQALCNQSNGSLLATVSGGTQPYTYLWENSEVTPLSSNLAAGTYSLTVTDTLGCIKLDSAVVTSNGQPDIQLQSAVNPLCTADTNGTITISITGGTSPYTTIWSNADTGLVVTNLGAGTYSVTVTDFTGCTDTASFVLTDPNPLAVSFQVTNANCNLPTGSVTAVPAGGTGTYGYQWSNSEVTQTISNLTPSTYTVTVTDQNLCKRTDSVVVANIPGPSAIVSSIQNVSCKGGNNGSINITVSGGVIPFTFLWSNTEVTEDLSNLIAGDYTITITDSAGCTGNLVVSITEPDSIVILSTAIPSTCGSANGSIQLAVSGGSPGYTFLWSNSDTTSTIQNLSSGSYTVTVTDNNSCTLQQTISLSNIDGPQISLVNITDVSCAGGSNGSIDIDVTQGAPTFNYLWSNSATTQDISGVPAGIYTVTVTDFNNCVSIFTDTINSGIPIVISVTATDATCGLPNGILTASASGGSGNFTYLWSTNDASSTISGLAAASYTVTVTDDSLCQQDSVFSIINTGSPVIALVAIDSVTCNGGNDGSIDISVSGGVGPYTFVWTNTAQVTEDIFGLTANGYSVIVTDFQGCTSNQAYTVSQPTAIQINFPLLQNASCGVANGSVALLATGGVPGYDYLWSTGSVNDTLFNLLANSYTVTVTDYKGCSISSIANISNLTGPSIVSVDSGNVSCYGGSNGFINIVVTGGTSPLTYSWSNLPDVSPSVSNLPAGTYTLTASDAASCLLIRSVTISQPDSILINAVTPQKNPPYNLTCYQSGDGEIFLSVNGGTAPYQFIWNTGALTQNLLNLSANTYTVFVTDQNGCTGSSNFTLTQPPQLISEAGTDITLCGENSTSLNAAVPNYGIGFWQVSGPQGVVIFSDSTSVTTQVSNLPLGDNTFTWTVSDGKCSVSSQVVVTVASVITAIPGIDRTICESTVNLNATRPQFGYGYWTALSPNVIIQDSSKSFTPAINLNIGTNIFQWTVVNGNCRDSASIEITRRDSIDCLGKIQIPNAFSPNSDGYNDVFLVKGLEDFTENSLVVYNRWGVVVYEKNNYRNDWAGTGNNGDPLPDGTYFVLLKVRLLNKVYDTFLDLRR